MINKFFITLFLLFFAGCGGGGGGGSSSFKLKNATGILIDSPISGIRYTCSTLSSSNVNITNTDGKFTCPQFSGVNFFIGKINLGGIILYDINNVEYITPNMLLRINKKDFKSIKLINFLRLVQSLDEDGNPDINGIHISEETHNEFDKLTENLILKEFEKNTLDNMFKKLKKPLVTKQKALKHYLETLKNTLKLSNFSVEPYHYQQWYLEKNDAFYKRNSINKDANIHADYNLLFYSGKGVKIAVLDSGLDIEHEDLKGAIYKTYDTKKDIIDVSHPNDTDTHGTAVTGILGARVNDKGITGIASNSDIIFLKMYFGDDTISDSDIIKLFNKAEEYEADIINCSWGSIGEISDALKDRIIDLAKNGRNGKGTIIVFGSGNDDEEMKNDESSIPEVISVGATNKDNLRSSYSNYGNNLDIVAPGGEFLGITTLDPSGDKGTENGDYTLYNSYNRFVGTSAATPIVSGIIAIMLEINPKLTRIQIDEILRKTSDKIGNLPYVNNRNDYYGYGKINLSKIVNEINLNYK